MALGNGHIDIAIFLFQNGWDGADDVMRFGVESDNASLVKTALGGRVTHQGVQAAMSAAERANRSALVPILRAALDALPTETTSIAPPAPVALGTPAISGGMIFVRTMGHVYGIGQ